MKLSCYCHNSFRPRKCKQFCLCNRVTAASGFIVFSFYILFAIVILDSSRASSDKQPRAAPSVQNSIIYTVGTSSRTQDEFFSILRHYAIETIVDVRRFPKSRFEHFTKNNLASLLEEQGIGYLYFGKELGGFRKEGYEAYTGSTTFKQSIAYLESTARKSVTAFVCAERLPWKCHRRFIASSLAQRGWEVLHIIDKNRVWRPNYADQERPEDRPV